MSERLPAVFIGHGNPLYAIDENRWTRAWRQLAESLPRPGAILSISAHWYVAGLGVTAMPRPRTIHDFAGFPPELFAVQYPAPGSPGLADEIAALLAPMSVVRDDGWGLDHGTWSVLVHMYPEADIPVVQLSIDGTKAAQHHLELGRRLAPLRERGVLLLGSGNIVHNLARADFGATAAFEWTVRFDEHVQRALATGDDQALVDYPSHPDGPLAVPTPDHYLPLLYVVGARHSDDAVGVVTEGYDAGSLSMRAVRIG
jgi:4,5-DOPA dioxygenase extradiol